MAVVVVVVVVSSAVELPLPIVVLVMLVAGNVVGVLTGIVVAAFIFVDSGRVVAVVSD